MDSKISKRSILILIFMMIGVIIVGTFAWLSYRTQDTAMVLTVGEIDSVRVTLSPYQINSSMGSVTAYTSGIVTEITASNSSSYPGKFRLFYNINTIDSQLAISAFRYTITRSTSKNGTYAVYGTGGNFAGATSNSQKTILEETLTAGQTYYYKVYLWLDGSGNVSSAQGKIFNGELLAEVDNFNSINKANEMMSALAYKATTVGDGVYFFDNNGNLSYGSNSSPISLGLTDNSPLGVVSIWNRKVIYFCLNYDDFNYEYNLSTNQISNRSMPCLTSRYDNLVINGDLSYQSNYNLTDFGTYNASGYLSRSGTASPFITDYIPVDTSKTYQIGMDMKSSNTTATYYAGYHCYDEKKRSIDFPYVSYFNGSLTTLTQDLVNGESTVVYLTNLSGWNTNTGNTKGHRGFIFWNYTDTTGYTYPELTFSRNNYYNTTTALYEDSAVNKSTNTITLTNTWAGPTIPAGTKVSQQKYTGGYQYNVLSSKTITTSWVTYNKNISGVFTNGDFSSTKFRPGTKYIRFLVLMNYNKTANTTTDIKNIFVREVQP